MDTDTALRMEQRLVKLERSNRQYRLVTVGLLCCIAVAVVLGAMPPNQVEDVVQAKRFVLVNDAGTPILVAENNGFGGMMTINNGQGKVVIAAGAQGSGAGVMGVGNSEGTPVGLILAGKSGAILKMVGPNNQLAFSAGAQDEGGGAITVNNARGATVISAKAQEQGGELTILNNKSAAVISQLAVENGGGIVVLDSLGKVRATMSAGDKSGSISLFNTGENVIWKAPSPVSGLGGQ